ncbi:MAG: 2-aminoadipate aminotransferase, partial [Pseudomonadota bacterium]
RHTLRSNYILMRNCIEASFPAGTTVSAPRGGYVVWVRLPESIDALKLYHACIQKGISIAPGPIFTRKMEMTNYMRLNFSHQWTPAIEQAVKDVGATATSLMNQ